MIHLMKIQSFLVVFVLVAGGALAQEKPLTRAQVDFFEKKIRPVLVENCYKCHSAKSEKVKGELLLDTKAGARGRRERPGGGATRSQEEPAD